MLWVPAKDQFSEPRAFWFLSTKLEIGDSKATRTRPQHSSSYYVTVSYSWENPGLRVPNFESATMKKGRAWVRYWAFGEAFREMAWCNGRLWMISVSFFGRQSMRLKFGRDLKRTKALSVQMSGMQPFIFWCRAVTNLARSVPGSRRKSSQIQIWDHPRVQQRGSEFDPNDTSRTGGVRIVAPPLVFGGCMIFRELNPLSC